MDSNLEQAMKFDGYDDSFVAFVDILGFKKFIYESKFEKAENLFKDIIHFADLVLKHPCPEYTEDQLNKVKINIISDSIVISIPRCVESSLDILIFTTITIVFNILLNYDLLCRGGIADGAFSSKGNAVFGASLVDAYNLENTVAVYPRIVFTQTICERYRYMSFGDLDQISDLIFFDNKEYLYIIDYLGYAIRRISYAVNNKEMSEYNAAGIFKKISDNIKIKLAEETDKHIREKYIYMASYYNDSISRISKSYEIPFVLEPITLIDLSTNLVQTLF